MSALSRVLWVLGRLLILLAGLAAVALGGFCGAITAPGAFGHDSLAREIFTSSLAVLGVGLLFALPAGLSLWRDHKAARGRGEAEPPAAKEGGEP